MAPHKAHHKESLAIYKLYTDYPTMKITRLLNHKFGSELPRKYNFKESLVEKKWEEMVEGADEVLKRVESYEQNYWRVTRVLKWAEKDDQNNPL